MSDRIRLARPDVGAEELRAVAEVVETGQLTMGPKVEELEGLLAGAVGTAHAAVVSSGTAALHLALLALEIGPGDEVVVPAYTFPEKRTDLAALRVVVRRGFTHDMADMLVADIERQLPRLQKQPAPINDAASGTAFAH